MFLSKIISIMSLDCFTIRVRDFGGNYTYLFQDITVLMVINVRLVYKIIY